MKIRPMGAELYLADRRTDLAKLVVALRSFLNSPKSGHSPFTLVTETSKVPSLNYIGGGIRSAA
jgi:hypothetical protein